MDDDNLIQTDVFPDKPLIEKDDNPLFRSVVSLALFIGAFYLFFNQDIYFILVLVFVLFIHELGHFAAMKYFNYKDVKMFFIPLLGALVTGEKQEVSQRQRAIILLAGPVPGIIIGLVLYKIGLETGNENIIMEADIFLFLNIFNLLPLTPLDGGNLIGTLFFNTKETLQTIFIILSAAGLALIALFLESYVFLIIPFFLLMGIRHQSKIKKIKARLDNEGIDYKKPYQELTNKEYWQIRKHMVQFAGIPPKEYMVSKHEQKIINQIKSLTSGMQKQDLSGISKSLFVGGWFFFIIGPFIALGVMLSPPTIEDYTEAIELNPNDDEAYNNRGLAYYNLGDLEQAIADYTHAIELDPDFAEAYYNRGVVYEDAGDWEQAIRDYELYLEFSPNAPDREEVISIIEDLKPKLEER